MKVIVAGCRDFSDYDLMKKHLDKIEITEIVCGMARGADSLGKRYAQENNIPVAEFPANWKRYGRGAGHLRNDEMANYGEMLVAFWDGKSSGTKSMIEKARRKKLLIDVVYFN